MEKEEYEKYISGANCYQHLLVANDKFHILMCSFGIHCSKCKKPFIPQPHWEANYSGVTHYPTKTVCGFCIYDMEGYEHSQLLEDEDTNVSDENWKFL